MQSSARLRIDEQLKDMTEMAEKAVIVLSLHFNDCCEGKIEVKRAKIALIGLHEVVSFIDSLPLKKKIAVFSELLSKALFIEMLGAYFMRHWTGTYVCADTLLYMHDLLSNPDIKVVTQYRKNYGWIYDCTI